MPAVAKKEKNKKKKRRSVRGEGVALARSVLVADEIAAQRLVPLFDVPYPEVFHYYLVTSASSANQKKTRIFREWILREAQDVWRAAALPAWA